MPENQPHRSIGSFPLDFDWKKPDSSSFVNPWDEKPLLEYYRSLLRAYGYFRLLGLPQLKDNPDIALESLFVEPDLLDRPSSEEQAAESFGRMTASNSITNFPRLIILGDPGTGKTSLMQWLITQLCKSGNSLLRGPLGSLVPIPCILRELPLSSISTWDQLLDLALSQPLLKPLKDNPNLFTRLLNAGQLFFILDGLDEVSAPSAVLRGAVHEGMLRHSNCRWLLTSRIVGYQQSPFDVLGTDTVWNSLVLHDIRLNESFEPVSPTIFENLEVDFTTTVTHLSDIQSSVRHFQSQICETRFIAPFDGRQIESLINNWYTEREADPIRRQEAIRELLRAIKGHAGTERLARIPNLLTMMALIHRVRARLPQGRVNLYNDIADAYLQTIDEYRGIREVDYTLQQKKFWLSRVAFEMQCRRIDEHRKATDNQPGILATQSDVEGWLADAMDISSEPQGRRESAAHFLAYLQRRTGLLLERSPGKFSFLHLSFQEYFAAFFLAEEVTGPDWLGGAECRHRCSPTDLKEYANESAWKETLVFLFELLGQERPRWVDRIAREVFSRKLAKPIPARELAPNSVFGSHHDEDLILGAELSVDPYSGFDDRLRREIWASVWHRAFPTGTWLADNPSANSLFSGAPQFSEGIWNQLIEISKNYPNAFLNLSGCDQLVDAQPLGQLQSVDTLYLNGSGIQRGLDALASISNLRSVSISWPGAYKGQFPLRGASSLRNIQIHFTKHTIDAAKLPLPDKLDELWLFDYGLIRNLSAWANHPTLTKLRLAPLAHDADFSIVAPFSGISDFSLFRSESVSNLKEIPFSGPIKKLTCSTMRNLVNVSPSAELNGLKSLILRFCTKVDSLDSLTAYPDLERLSLQDCNAIGDLSPLAKCPALKSLILDRCNGITSLAPLSRSANLESVEIRNYASGPEIPTEMAYKVKVVKGPLRFR